jgi:hypothetical protein
MAALDLFIEPPFNHLINHVIIRLTLIVPNIDLLMWEAVITFLIPIFCFKSRYEYAAKVFKEIKNLFNSEIRYYVGMYL